MSAIRTAKVLVVATVAAAVTVDSDRLYSLYSSRYKYVRCCYSTRTAFAPAICHYFFSQYFLVLTALALPTLPGINSTVSGTTRNSTRHAVVLVSFIGINGIGGIHGVLQAMLSTVLVLLAVSRVVLPGFR